MLEGDHFYLPFYHLSQSQKCYGRIILSHASVTSNDSWVFIVLRSAVGKTHDLRSRGGLPHIVKWSVPLCSVALQLSELSRLYDITTLRTVQVLWHYNSQTCLSSVALQISNYPTIRQTGIDKNDKGLKLAPWVVKQRNHVVLSLRLQSRVKKSSWDSTHRIHIQSILIQI